MLRPSLPRFFNFGDTAQVSVVLVNQTDDDMNVMVACQAKNLAVLAPGLRALLPANSRGLVRFALVADVGAGESVVQLVCAAGPNADAATVKVPVFTPATSEAFATYGEAARPDDAQIQV